MENTIITIKHADLENYTISEYAKEQPEMTNEVYSLVKQDIENNGQQIPVVIYNKEIYDGRHRYRAAKDLGIDLRAIKAEGIAQAKTIAESNNEHRRHLSKSQYAIRAAFQLIKDDKLTIAETMEVKNKLVSERLVKSAKKIAKNNKDLATAVFNGTKNIEEASKEINTKKEKKQANTDAKVEYKIFLTNVNQNAADEFEKVSKKVGISKDTIAKEYIYTKHKLLDTIKELNKKLDDKDKINLDEIMKTIESELSQEKKNSTKKSETDTAS